MNEPFKMQLAAEVGKGRTVDLEFDDIGLPWIVLGELITRADVWLEQIGSLGRVRVRISRGNSGVEICVDRGEDSEGWWPAEAVPRLVISLANNGKRAVAIARVGDGTEFQEVVLGTIDL